MESICGWECVGTTAWVFWRQSLRRSHLHSGADGWEGFRHIGSWGNCVPGSRKSKFRGPEREKTLAYLRNRMVAKTECSGGRGRGVKALEASVRNSDNNNNSWYYILGTYSFHHSSQSPISQIRLLRHRNFNKQNVSSHTACQWWSQASKPNRWGRTHTCNYT